MWDRWLSAVADVEAIEQVLQDEWALGLPPNTTNAILSASVLCSTGKVNETHLNWVLKIAKDNIHEGRSVPHSCTRLQQSLTFDSLQHLPHYTACTLLCSGTGTIEKFFHVVC